MTLQDQFVLQVQTECICQVYSGDMALNESRTVMSAVFGVRECDIEGGIPEKPSYPVYQLAMEYISWKLHETAQPNWIK